MKDRNEGAPFKKILVHYPTHLYRYEQNPTFDHRITKTVLLWPNE